MMSNVPFNKVPLNKVSFNHGPPNLALPSPRTQTALEMFCPGEAAALFKERQTEFFLNHYQEFEAFCHDRLGLYQHIADHLWNFWLPLAHGLRHQRDQNQTPWIQGVVGLQGTGKTTLTQILTWILHKWGYRCLSLSLDDLYLPYSDRLRLQQENPGLIWRGPPGTHDVELGLAVLTGLQAQTEANGLWVPRFNKSLHGGAGDRDAPEWISLPVDMVLFEGWFVGMSPLSDPVAQGLESSLAQYCNQQLQHYIPLWNRLNALLVLHLPQTHCSKLWRQEAEDKMSARTQSGMKASDIDRFVDYFWEALPPEFFLERLAAVPCLTQLVELQEDRSPPKFPQFP
jgi:D-glycerate 3-kinase